MKEIIGWLLIIFGVGMAILSIPESKWVVVVFALFVMIPGGIYIIDKTKVKEP